MDLPDDVYAIHHQRPRARHPQRDMKRRTALGDVHRLPAEHRLHLLGELSLRRQLPQKLEGVVGDAMLRVVEIQAGRFGGQPLAARRIGVEEIPADAALDLPECHCSRRQTAVSYEGLSHGARATASVSVVYAPAGSSCQKIALPATSRSAPACRAVPIVSGVDASVHLDACSLGQEPPQTPILPAASGMNAWPE